MQYLREKLQMKAGRLRNVTIAGHSFEDSPVYERDGKALEGMFKTYMNALPDGDDILGEPTLNDIVKLLTMHGESKSGLSTYYI